MPKHKPRKSVSKRFKLTKTGKLLHRLQHGRHLRRNKTKSNQRKAKVLAQINGGVKRMISKML